MQAKVGDNLVIEGRTTEIHRREGEIVEVRGEDGAPPYVVRWSDGHEALTYPGPGRPRRRRRLNQRGRTRQSATPLVRRRRTTAPTSAATSSTTTATSSTRPVVPPQNASSTAIPIVT